MIDAFRDNLALIMFVVMFLVIFTGYPVAIVLGGTGLVFAVMVMGTILDRKSVV